MNKHYFFLDSSYVSIVLQYGLLVLGVVLLCWVCISFKAAQQKDMVLLLIVCLISIQCMVEHHMLEIAYNPFIWAVFADMSTSNSAGLIMKKGRKKEKICLKPLKSN